jgi:hypothetical protein
MRLIMWIIAILSALAGLALRADGGFGVAAPANVYAPWIAQGLFIVAILACPFLWAPRYQLVPRALAPTGKQRFLLVLALILATPLLLPWPF